MGTWNHLSKVGWICDIINFFECDVVTDKRMSYRDQGSIFVGASSNCRGRATEALPGLTALESAWSEVKGNRKCTGVE